jgi:subfamily B ATP-binding cassette protein MsbA
MPFKEFIRVLRRLLGYVAPYWPTVTVAFLCTFFVTFAKLSQAKFIGVVFGLMSDKNLKSIHVDPQNPLAHDIEGHHPFTIMVWVCLAFLVMMIAMGFASYLSRYLINKAGQAASRDLRQVVFAHIQRLPLQFFDQMRLGEIQSRASGDVSTSAQVLAQLSDFATNLLLVVVAMSWMLYEDWEMTALVLVLSPLIGLAVSGFGHQIGVHTERLQSRAADLSAIVYESISSIKVVKAYNREDFEIKRFGAKNQESYDIQMRLVQVSASQAPVVEFLGALGIVAIVCFGAWRVLTQGVQFAQITEYWTLLVMTTQPISALSGYYSSFQASAAAAKRVFVILDAPLEVEGESERKPLPAVHGEIVFDHVGFGYDGKTVFENLSLTVAQGEVLAIVGGNGAGKTTLVNLVSRFYRPQSGQVRIDGHDLAGVTLSSLRSQIGVVIQESVLFGGSIADNIACGNARATQADVEKAARLANAHDFIVEQVKGYDTEIGERGMRLSGGQRQRIAIARALLRDPRILILDEFTSGIDAESENLITDAIQKSMVGRTCLVIAHRLNTIRHADRIIVLDGGKIVEEGTHDELLARQGSYARIFQAQRHQPSLIATPVAAVA